MTGDAHTLDKRMQTTLDVLQGLDQRGVAYCVLRGFDGSGSPGRDVDMIIRPHDRAVMGSVATEVGRSWASVCECRHHVGRSYYFLDPSDASEPIRQLELHCTAVGWAGLPVLEEGEILRGRVRGANGVWVASPVDRCLQVLLQQVLSGGVRDLNGKDRAVLTAAPVGRTELVARVVSVLGDEELAGAIVANMDDADALSRLVWPARRAFVLHRLRDRPVRALRDVAHYVTSQMASRAIPRCGLVASIDVPTNGAVERVSQLTKTMFLRNKTARVPAETPRHLKLCHELSWMSLVLLVGDVTTRTRIRLPRVLRLSHAMSDEQLKDAVIAAFTTRHRRLT